MPVSQKALLVLDRGVPFAPALLDRSFEAQRSGSFVVGIGFTLLMFTAVCFTTVILVLFARKQQQAELERSARLISRYIPSQLAEKIIKGEHSETFKPERAKLTVFFSDVEGFTEASDHLDPEDLAALLNEYFSEMVMIAERFGATINQIVGDGIMAFFGAPQATSDKDHALRAVSMALEMQRRMVELKRRMDQSGHPEAVPHPNRHQHRPRLSGRLRLAGAKAVFSDRRADHSSRAHPGPLRAGRDSREPLNLGADSRRHQVHGQRRTAVQGRALPDACVRSGRTVFDRLVVSRSRGCALGVPDCPLSAFSTAAFGNVERPQLADRVSSNDIAAQIAAARVRTNGRSRAEKLINATDPSLPVTSDCFRATQFDDQPDEENSLAHARSAARKPSSVNVTDLYLFAGSSIRPFSCSRSVMAQPVPSRHGNGPVDLMEEGSHLARREHHREKTPALGRSTSGRRSCSWKRACVEHCHRETAVGRRPSQQGQLIAAGSTGSYPIIWADRLCTPLVRTDELDRRPARLCALHGDTDLR